jgi:hypothetical protein
MKVKSQVGFRKILEMSRLVRGVTGVALVKVDGALRLMPLVDVERMRLAGKKFELIATAETAEQLRPYVKLLSSQAKP